MNIIRYLFLFGCCLGLDRWSKWWAVMHHVDVQVCPVLNFSLLWNRGVSWGVFHGASSSGFYLLTTCIMLITIALAYYALYLQWYKRGANIFLETLVLAGAVSNLIDRFMFGSVIDFIQFHVNAWYWPTFNLADMFVVGGVIGLLIKNMMRSHEDQS